jgi:hypothetical protein
LSAGPNPVLPSDFIFSDTFDGCPIVSGGALEGILPANSSCSFAIIFAPVANGQASGSMVMTDNNLNAAAPGFATQPVTLNGGGSKTTPVIHWPTPAAVTFGATLSATQLNAAASTPGTFVYKPAAGTFLHAGTVALLATFTPADSVHFTSARANNTLVVNKVAPKITWPAPAAISAGTPLSATLLNATASTPGTFQYSLAAGTIPAAGTVTLSVTFTPTDTGDFTTATATNTLVVK